MHVHVWNSMSAEHEIMAAQWRGQAPWVPETQRMLENVNFKKLRNPKKDVGCLVTEL